MAHGPATGLLIRAMFARQRRDVALCTLFWSVHQVCEALVPVAIGTIIDRAVSTSDGSSMIWAVVGLLVLFTFLTMGWRTGFWFLSRAQLEESHLLRMRAVRRIITGRGIETERQTGEVLSIATSDAESAAELLSLGSRATSALIGLVVTAVVLLRIDWVLGLGMMVGIPLLVLGLNALGPVVERRTSAQQQAIGLAAATASDLLAGLRPLRGFGGVTEAVERYRRTSRTSLRSTVGAVQTGAAFVGASTFVTGLLLAVVAIFAGWFALQGRISVGELITIVGLAAFITDPVLSLADCVFQLATSRASATRIAELLNAPLRSESGAVAASPGRLTLRGVVSPGLRHLDLVVEPGELVAVVAGDIAAADAVTALLSGARRPERGLVELAGVSLADLDLPSLRQVMLVEPHVVDFFGATLREVLITSDGSTSRDRDSTTSRDQELVAVMQAASLSDFVSAPVIEQCSAAPESGVVATAAGSTKAAGGTGEQVGRSGPGLGLDRELLDRGANLSGGQRQRVALARALLADRPVLVLRDPTTAVDAVTEHSMADGLRRLRTGAGRSTVLVTTSAPLLARCDRVVFVADGRVHSTGPHAELLGLAEYAEVVLR